MRENTLVKWQQTMTYWLRLEQQSALMCTNTWKLNSGQFVSHKMLVVDHFFFSFSRHNTCLGKKGILQPSLRFPKNHVIVVVTVLHDSEYQAPVVQSVDSTIQGIA